MTSDAWGDLTGPGALHRFAPEPARALRSVVATVGGRPELDALARSVCAAAQRLPAVAVLEHPALADDADDAVDADDATARVATAYAEQFSVDVSMIDDAHRDRLAQALGESAQPFVWSCYVADLVPRLRAVLDALFGPDPDGWPVDEPCPADSARTAAMELGRVVHDLALLDPVTSELVRLRGARQHGCRICQSLRSRPALAAGASDADFDAVDDHAASDLPPRRRAALALTDAMIWQPGSLPAGVLDDVRAHLTPAEATEVVLDVLRNALNKVAVALGTDAARVAEGYKVYEIDADGVMRIG